MLTIKILECGLRIRNILGKIVLRIKDRKNKSTSLLFITSNNPISASQIFPFFYFQSELRKQLNVIVSEMRLDTLLSTGASSVKHADFVFFQPWFNTSFVDLRGMFEIVRSVCPNAKFIFLDSYAPVDLRLAEKTNDFVDVYVKKHVFRERSRYGKETLGDTNLVEYYGKLYGICYEPTTFNIPNGFIDKLVVGPSFLTSNVMLPFFTKQQIPKSRVRHIDVHARLGGTGDDWYGRMRTHAIESIRAIPNIKAVTDTGLSQAEYLRELGAAKLCFSPFGFGEVCWRDYEAVMCGALMLKPEMDHVETTPNIFIPYQTYVPIKWDFSDLEEKIVYYLKNDSERMRIAENAYRVIRNYAVSNQFIDHVNAVLNLARQSQSGGLPVSIGSKVTTQ